MGVTDLTRISTATPAGLWSVLTDFAAYGAWIPLTTMETDPGEPGLGWQFAGLSGVGRVRFSDSMLLTRWEPPDETGHGAFRVVKTGRLLAGWAEVEVAPDAAGGSRVRWREEIITRPVPVGRLLAVATGRVTERMFGSALEAMVARADSETDARSGSGSGSGAA